METAVKRTGRTPISKGTARICSNCVDWFLYGKDLALSAMDMEQITNALIDNNLEGILYTIAPNGAIISGGWSIQW